MKCDRIGVMDTTGCIAFFVALCSYIRVNAYCHLSGGDDNILSSCIDQSDDTIHLLRYMHTKATKLAKCLFFRHSNPITLHLKSEVTIKP